MAENLESETKIDARPTASQTEIGVDAIPTVNQNLSSVQGCFEDNPGSSSSNSQSHSDQSGRELFISRDEMNLVEFPLAVLSTRVNPKLKTLEFQDSQRLSSGQVIEREWIITGADKFGLPTSTDDDVVLALMRLTFENGFKNRKVYFTRYELLKILRWSTEGRSYRRLTKSLDRLSGVRIKASNAFFSNSDKAWQTRNFGLIDAYEINDGRNRKASAKEGSASLKTKKPTSFFIWSEVLFNSFKDGFIKKVDLDLYFSLQSAVSRRLYRYLDKHFFYKAAIDRNLMVLAFEKLGISRNYRYVSSVKQQLEPAIEELVRVGYLADYAFRGRGADTVVRFVKAGSQASHPALVHGGKAQGHDPVDVQGLSSDHKRLIEAIASRGISENIARKLLKARTISECRQIKKIVRYYDHLVATDDVKISKNATGFLYRAVENPAKFRIPASFEVAERDQKAPGARPEHRLIAGKSSRPGEGRASEAPGSEGRVAQPRPVQTRMVEDSAQSPEYLSFLDAEISKAKRSLGPSRLKAMESEVSAKFVLMRGVLKEKQIEAAVQGCVQKEIMTIFEIPEYEAWKK